MSRIRFEDLPSTNTPITAENLDKLNNVVISPTEPTTGEEVWIKKGKNKFNANELFLDQTNHVTNNNSTNKLSITTNGNYGYSRYKLTIPNEYLNKEVSISFNGVSTINKSQNNIRNTIYISSTPDESGDIMTQLLTTTKTKYSIKFTPNSQEIYITLYGTLSDYSTIMTIEMSEIQLELGEPTEYEDYIEKEIYVKNDSGVFERFYKNNGIIDNGSNDNFKYIKFSDGTLIQYATITFSNPTWASWGSLYSYDIDMTSYVYPIPFISRPTLSGNVTSGGSAGNGWIARLGSFDSSCYTSIGTLTIVRPTTYSGPMVVNIIAVGRWK